MADNKNSRDKKADDEARRQRERDLATELERSGETEPPIDTSELAYVETQLEGLEFPKTGAEVVERIGDESVEASSGTYSLGELVPETDAEVFGSPSEVRAQIQRPKVAAAVKRVVEAVAESPNSEFGASQRDAYEKTLRELRRIDADDNDEGVEYIADWIVEYVEQKSKLPGSRLVRKEAAEFCRKNGYSVRNDDWLGA